MRINTIEYTRPLLATRAPLARRVDRTALAVALLIVAGVGYRLYLTLNLAPPTNSDESTMGLAALHIAEGRHFPVFFYGQNHMGTLEAYLAAPLFVLFGPSIVALRLPMLVLYAGFCALMYKLTVRLYGRRFAVLVVALLAVGSHAVVRGEMFAGGGYPEIKPIGAGLLLLSVWLATGSGHRRWLGFALWGLLAGLALWTDWLILPYVATAGVVLGVRCRRELYGRAGATLAAGFVVGALPSIVHHVQTGLGGSTLTDLLHLSRSGHTSIGDRLRGGVLLGVPMGTGLCEAGGCAGWPLVLGAAYPVLLAVAGTLAVRGLRAARRLGQDPIRHAGRLALVAGAALTLIGYTRSDAAGLSPATNVRYLTPLLVSLPAVLWPLWSGAIRGRSRPGRLAGAGLLGLHVVAMVQATAVFVGAMPGSHAAARDERALIARVAELGLTRIYSEYWTCGRITFGTRERTVCAALADDLRPGVDRYLPYRDAVASAANPAYVLPIGSPVERAFAQRLRDRGVTADLDEVAGYRIYRPRSPVGVPIR